MPTNPAETPTSAALPATPPDPVASPTVVAVGTTIAPARPTSNVVVVQRTPTAQENLDRWRAQQDERQVLETAQTYVATSPAPLLWYDPLTGQSVLIGTLIGDFVVQARFVVHSTQQPALEVPYFINRDYGLTSISDAVRDRMKAAGYTESVEAYVIQTEGIAPK